VTDPRTRYANGSHQAPAMPRAARHPRGKDAGVQRGQIGGATNPRTAHPGLVRGWCRAVSLETITLSDLNDKENAR